MDPALLRQREAFRKHAMAVPTIEKKPKAETSSSSLSKDRDDNKKKMYRPPTAPRLDASSYKTMSGSSQYRFGVLAKIVKHMKTRHQEGEDYPLTLEEILDETNQLDVGNSVKAWLSSEALMNNPKIEVSEDKQRFVFKPVYKIKDGKTLLRLLKQHDLKGLGGILLDDVQESLPHCEKVLKNRASEILYVIRPVDKKKILFYNDKTANFSVDEEFQKLWRSVAVDSMDDGKINEYLEKQGIRSMQDNGPKKLILKRKKPSGSKKRQFKRPRDNEHLADVLETYDDNSLTQKGVPVSNNK